MWKASPWLEVCWIVAPPALTPWSLSSLHGCFENNEKFLVRFRVTQAKQGRPTWKRRSDVFSLAERCRTAWAVCRYVAGAPSDSHSAALHTVVTPSEDFPTPLGALDAVLNDEPLHRVPTRSDAHEFTKTRAPRRRGPLGDYTQNQWCASAPRRQKTAV